MRRGKCRQRRKVTGSLQQRTKIIVALIAVSKIPGMEESSKNPHMSVSSLHHQGKSHGRGSQSNVSEGSRSLLSGAMHQQQGSVLLEEPVGDALSAYYLLGGVLSGMVEGGSSFSDWANWISATFERHKS